MVSSRAGPPPARTGGRSPRAAPAGHRRPGRGARSLIRSKSTPSNSPPNARTASASSRSEPGAAMRAMMVAMASARCVPLKPSRSSRAAPAHSPTFSTPTERGRINSGTHIHRLQVGALDCGGRCAIEELRGDARASRSTSCGQDSGTSSWRSSSCWIRAHRRASAVAQREVAAEVEQGVLADPVSAALVARGGTSNRRRRVRLCVSWRAG